MPGFRLWEQVSIEDLLDHLCAAALEEARLEMGQEPDERFRRCLRRAMKRVLNQDMYASPVCGDSSVCQPAEEARVKPWSQKAAEWGLVRRADE